MNELNMHEIILPLGVCSDEQYSATENSARENVRVDGWRQARGRCGEHFERLAAAAQQYFG